LEGKGLARSGKERGSGTIPLGIKDASGVALIGGDNLERRESCLKTSGERGGKDRKGRGGENAC